MMGAPIVFAGRALRRFVRSPETLISTVGFPLVLFLTLLAVMGTAVEAFEEAAYAQRLVPGMVLAGIMFGSIGSAVGFFTDLENGFMNRVKTLPISPSTPLLGTVLAEAVRALSSVIALVALGYLFDFRFDNGVGPTIGFLAIAALAAVSIVWISLALATVASSQEAINPPLSSLFLVLLFFSPTMIPLDAYPGWAQPVVRLNPATSYVKALDHLARGGPLRSPILASIAWSVALIVVFGLVAIRAVQRRR